MQYPPFIKTKVLNNTKVHYGYCIEIMEVLTAKFHFTYVFFYFSILTEYCTAIKLRALFCHKTVTFLKCYSISKVHRDGKCGLRSRSQWNMERRRWDGLSRGTLRKTTHDKSHAIPFFLWNAFSISFSNRESSKKYKHSPLKESCNVTTLLLILLIKEVSTFKASILKYRLEKILKLGS